MESLVHPDLLANERVTLEKFHPKNLKRVLDEGEAPFPVMPKIGPYVEAHKYLSHFQEEIRE